MGARRVIAPNQAAQHARVIGHHIDRESAAAHARGLKVILDFVPNHTSDEHPWFVESRQDRGSPKRDWYVWRDAAADGGVPNNWLSHFGGAAWTWTMS